MAALPGHSAFAGADDCPDRVSLPGPPLYPGHAGTVDRFDLIRCIGEGGMGLVYLARDPAGSALVAIKILKPELAQNSRALACFAKEAQHMQGLAHPNILPVLEFKAAADEAYMVMPFRARGSLSNLLTPGVALPEPLTLSVAQQIAAALHFAHHCEIVHRDVKPSNILLDEAGRACLADFGLSRSLLNDVLIDVHQNHWEGTASYLSPGAARGEREDTRLDIYSLGALLFEMLTGYPPYQGATRQEVIAQIIAGPPKPIRELNPQAAPALIRIAEGAMARDLRERYAHLSFVLEDLDRVQHGQSPLGPNGGNKTAASFDSKARNQIGAPVPQQTRALWMRIGWRILNWLAVGLVGVLGYVISPWFLPLNDAALAQKSKPGLNLISRFELPGVFAWNNALWGDFNYGSVQLKLWWIGDINGDGRPEFVFTSSQREFVSGINPGQPKGPLAERFFHDNNVILLDTNLTQLGRF